MIGVKLYYDFSGLSPLCTAPLERRVRMSDPPRTRTAPPLFTDYDDLFDEPVIELLNSIKQ